MRFILQKQPTIWGDGNWHERLGLPPRAQGTGMQTDEARAFHIADPALFMEYTKEVWREFEAYLAGITDGGTELSERIVTVKPLGDMPAIQAIGQVCISHLFIHLGEVASLLGAMGKRGLPIPFPGGCNRPILPTGDHKGTLLRKLERLQTRDGGHPTQPRGHPQGDAPTLHE